MTSLEKALQSFAEFAAKLKGDEKSEAQTFLFHLLETFAGDVNPKHYFLARFGCKAGSIHHPVERRLDLSHPPQVKRRHKSTGLQCRQSNLWAIRLVNPNGAI